MKLEIFGAGCSRCGKLHELAVAAVNELGVTAEIVKVEEISAIVDRGVMSTPALAIDGTMKSAGRVPSKEELKRWIEEACAGK